MLKNPDSCQIRARDYSVWYPSSMEPGQKGRQVLANLDFTITAGERILLLGPSGSGKSTLALSLAGILPHSIYAETAGDLEVQGLSILEQNPAEMARRVGVLFQDPDSQLTMLTVEQEVAFGLENLGLEPKEMDAAIDRALEAVGMQTFRRQPVDTLSGGMKQRLVLAALLAMEPEILVLDEPVSNLDPQSAAEVAALIHEICSRQPDLTLVLVEHRIDPFLQCIDRVLVLNANGQLVLDESPQIAFGARAADLRKLNVWIPVAANADWQAQNGSLESWCSPRQKKTRQAEVLLEIKDLDFSYQARERATGRRTVDSGLFNRLSLQFNKGEVCALVGANGSGKSTLAALAVGLLSPQRGVVSLEGRDIKGIRAGEMARLVGYVFQNPEHQFVTDRVIDEIAFNDPAPGQEAVEEILKSLRLTDYATENPFSLSHGQKRRLSAGAMLVNPRSLLVMDEPTFGQDPSALEELIEMLNSLTEAGTAVVLITHDMDLVWRQADRMLVLESGQILADGDPQELFADSALLQKAGISAPPCADYWQQSGWQRSGERQGVMP